MKTWFDIADEYAREIFPQHEVINDWYSFLNYYGSKHPEWFAQYYLILSKRYAVECVKASLEKASENVELIETIKDSAIYDKIDKQSITSPDNIILL